MLNISYIDVLTLPASTIQVAAYGDNNTNEGNLIGLKDGAGAIAVSIDTNAAIMYSGSYQI